MMCMLWSGLQQQLLKVESGAQLLPGAAEAGETPETA
eukprot:CAMPEP_0197730692 /NCGR_PEP_ID=MMETSP1434-20131217/35237_1 /TAXON_ID=265543 /ORGANISM="Minutocellus polymorphus, Strain CCMP3303" /LENGTH=36 /DNA_ID= /DNA_START= /DNA_END= /DNA_ORIENTATION=